MLHSQFMPHIVVTMLQNWLGLGHAAFLQKAWFDCGKSLLHTKLGSHHVFFAAMLHSLFVPHIVVTVTQNWLGLGHAEAVWGASPIPAAQPVALFARPDQEFSCRCYGILISAGFL